ECRQTIFAANLADVLGEANRADFQTRVVVQNGSGDRHRQLLSPTIDEQGLEVLDIPRPAEVAAAHGLHDALSLGERRVDLDDALSEDLGGGIAEGFFGAVVVEYDRPSAVDGDDDVRRVFNQLFQIMWGKWKRRGRVTRHRMFSCAFSGALADAKSRRPHKRF